jgi:hypothetical protein
VDGEAHVVAVDRDSLSAVDPHADSDISSLGPGVLDQAPLSADGSRDRLPGTAEHHEERVAFGVHLSTCVRHEGCSQDSAVSREQVAVAAAGLAEQPR